MQKLIGCVLVITASSGIGYLKGLDLQKHLEALGELRQIFLMLKSEIKYTKTPLGEAFYHIGKRMKNQYTGWLEEVSERLSEKSATVFAEVWNQTIDCHLKNTALSLENIKLLKAAGIHMGYMDEEMQLAAIQLFLEQLELEIQTISENLVTQRKLCNCLGVMGGIFLAVVLM